VSLSRQTFSQIRRIDNSRQWLPFLTSILIIFLFVVLIWFFKGGSFRLYASAFFGLYFLTHQIWVSVLLIGILQNIIFLPLRFISLKLSTSLHNFEEELGSVKNEREQYFLFTDKVKSGNPAILFYIFTFVVNAIAFFSAGRIFLIDFYSQKLDPSYLYSFIPYPSYPLNGTDFNFPFFTVNETTSLAWSKIFLFWFILTLAFALPRILWRLVKPLLWKSKKILSARINYNRLLISTGGFSLTFLILSIFILRNIPVSLSFRWLVADLTRQNSTMNLITAIGTFITTLHAGHNNHSRASKVALEAGIEKAIVNKVYKQRMRQSFKNALILGIGAYMITSQIPSAFELSVATFEVLYILSPYTFDRFLKAPKKSPPKDEVAPASA